MFEKLRKEVEVYNSNFEKNFEMMIADLKEMENIFNNIRGLNRLYLPIGNIQFIFTNDQILINIEENNLTFNFDEIERIKYSSFSNIVSKWEEEFREKTLEKFERNVRNIIN